LGKAVLKSLALFFILEACTIAAAKENQFSLKLAGQIGGPTQGVAIQGSYAYVGVGLRLVVLDISRPGSLAETGATRPFSCPVEDVAVNGSLACVAAGGAGLRIVDISDPFNPIEIGAWDSSGYAEGVAVVGNTAYLADGPYGLRILDISKPEEPREIGFAFPANYAFKVALEGHYAYISAAGAGLLVANVSDQANPIEVGTCYTSGYAYGVAVAGNAVYIADGWEGLKIVDVSVKANPRLAGQYKTQGRASGVAISGSLAFVADAFKGLAVLNVSNTLNPSAVGTYEESGGHAGSVTVVGGMAYVADRNLGLQLIAVSDPDAPFWAGSYRSMGLADAVSVTGRYAYAAAGNYGLRIIDISDPNHPRQVGAYDTQSYATSVVVINNYAYVATSSPPDIGQGLHVVDISNPELPVRIGFRKEEAGAYRAMAVSGAVVYLANEHGLQLVDISNPQSPKEIGFVRVWEWPGGEVLSSAVGVFVEGNLAYVAAERAGIKIIDVSNPADPRVIGQCSWPGAFAQNVIVSKGLAYLADMSNGLTIVDVSAPFKPFRVGFYDTIGMAESLTQSDDLVYVADGGAGVSVVDVSRPSNPGFVTHYNTPGNSQDIVINGNYVFIADQDAGLLILEKAQTRAILGTVGVSTFSEPHSNKDLIAEAESTKTVFEAGHPVTSGLIQRSPSITSATGRLRDEFLVPSPDFETAPEKRTCSVTSTDDSGYGTLRRCLEDSESGIIITFDPVVFPCLNPSRVILSSSLPHLAEGNTTIDASDAGVILDGSSTPEETSGLTVVSASNVIKGLQIINFPANGITIKEGGKNNIIGGDRAKGKALIGEGNLLSGNGCNGLEISGEGTTDNIIKGNLIGSNLSGTEKFGNSGSGVSLFDGAQRNQIGGLTSGERNIISGNQYAGICLNGETATGNIIAGNLIGTDIWGTSALGNGEHGISISSPENRIGGTTKEERNVISGNSAGHGISLINTASVGNLVIGNYIGIDADGKKVLGNGDHGVAIQMGASNNTASGNVIVSTGRNCILINDWGSSYNTVVGNLLGTDASGTVCLQGTDYSAVHVGMGAGFNRIGGKTAEERNVIVGGVTFARQGQIGNMLIGNFIGTDASGIKGLGASQGVVIGNGSRRPFIGGTTQGERNLISGNNSDGIQLDPIVDYVFIGGNYIGTDAGGAIPVSNHGDGIKVDRGEHNFIQNNLIAYNSGTGINIVEYPFNTIRHNSIHSNTQKGITNTGLPVPAISTIAGDSISGNSCPGCTIEVFSDAEDEGRIYEGNTCASASGAFTFVKNGLLTGPFITATATDADGNTSEFSLPKTMPEGVLSPNAPNGIITGSTGLTYSYSTVGSISNFGHSVEYQFDWKGDGSDLSGWGPAVQSKIWDVPGIYIVKVRARCSVDISVSSRWSSGLKVVVSSSDSSFIFVSLDGMCNGHTPCFSSIQGAINSSGKGVIIFIAEGSYAESLTLTGQKQLRLHGGWNSDFTGLTLNTAIQGSLMIGDAALIVENVTFR